MSERSDPWKEHKSASGRLTNSQENFLRLILRSPDIGEGWRRFSKQVWPLIENFGRKEMLEVDGTKEGGKIRLSERGLVVCDYIWRPDA